MINLGDFKYGQSIYVPFSSYDSNGASVTMTGLAVTDIEVYKNGSVTQRASDNGYALLDTDGIDFDGITGIHGFSIDTADNTTAGFWGPGNDYFLVVSAITIDTRTVNFVYLFSIENRGGPPVLARTTIATLASQTSFTLTAGSADDDAYNGCIIVIQDVGSTVQKAVGVILDYTGSTKTVTLLADPAVFTMATTDYVTILADRSLKPTVPNRTLDVSTGGEGGVDWANIGSPTTTVGLSGTTVKTATDVETDTADIQGRLPAALVSGRIDASVGAMAANVMTAAAAAADFGAEIADAVWDEDATGHQTQGTFGQAIGDPGADSDTIWSLANTNLNATVGSRASQTTADAIEADTQDLQAKLGTPSNLGGGATVAANLSDIEGQTDDIGVAGAGLTAVPWNAAWDAEVQSEATDALNAYDPPTRAEATADKTEIIAYLDGMVIAKGTIGSTGNSTTALHLTGLTYGNDEINNYLLAIRDVSAGEWHARYIEDWADTGDLATVATLPFTPENAVDTYVILAFRQDVTGGAGLDAAGVRAAVGLASANLDTQLNAIVTDTAEIGAAGAGLTNINLPNQTMDIVGNITGNVSGSVGSVTGAVGSVTAGVTLANDAITAAKFDETTAFPLKADDSGATQVARVGADGDTLETLSDQLDALPTAASNADAVWDEDATGHQTQGTFGQAIGDPAADSDSIWALANTNLDATVSSRATPAQVNSEADTALSDAGVTTARMARLDADVSSRSSHSAADVWAAATRSLTDKAGFSLSAAGIQAIWDALTSALTTAGSIGKLLVDNINATISSRSTVTTAQVNTEVDTALADVGLTTTITGRVDAAVSTRATPAQVNTEVLDVLTVDTFAQPGQGTPAATDTLANKLSYLAKWARNKRRQRDTGALEFYNDDASTVDQKQTVTDDGDDLTVTEMVTGP